MHPRTLNRALQARGLSFRDAVNEARFRDREPIVARHARQRRQPRADPRLFRGQRLHPVFHRHGGTVAFRMEGAGTVENRRAMTSARVVTMAAGAKRALVDAIRHSDLGHRQLRHCKGAKVRFPIFVAERGPSTLGQSCPFRAEGANVGCGSTWSVRYSLPTMFGAASGRATIARGITRQLPATGSALRAVRSMRPHCSTRQINPETSLVFARLGERQVDEDLKNVRAAFAGRQPRPELVRRLKRPAKAAGRLLGEDPSLTPHDDGPSSLRHAGSGRRVHVLLGDGGRAWQRTPKPRSRRRRRKPRGRGRQIRIADVEKVWLSAQARRDSETWTRIARPSC